MQKLQIKAVAFARTPEQLQNSGLSSLFIPLIVAEVQRCMWFAVYIVGGTRPEVYPEVVLNGAANCRQQLRRRHAHDCCFAAASSRERRCCNTMAFEPVGGCGGY